MKTTLILCVYDDKVCDLYFCNDLYFYNKDEGYSSCKKKLENKLRNDMTDCLINILSNYDNGKSIRNFGECIKRCGLYKSFIFKPYYEIPLSCMMSSFLELENLELEDVYLCDFRINRSCRPVLIHCMECVGNDSIHLSELNFADIIHFIHSSSDYSGYTLVADFKQFKYYGIIEETTGKLVAPVALVKEETYISKSRELASLEEYRNHTISVVKYKDDINFTKVYSCIKRDECSNVIALDLNQKDVSVEESSKYDTFKSNHYEVAINGDDILRISCYSVDVCEADKIEIKVGLYLTNENYQILSGINYNINTEHHLNVKLYKDDCSDFIMLFSLQKFILKKKEFSGVYNKSDNLIVYFTFEQI